MKQNGIIDNPSIPILLLCGNYLTVTVLHMLK